jgi:hypothetical protein
MSAKLGREKMERQTAELQPAKVVLLSKYKP